MGWVHAPKMFADEKERGFNARRFKRMCKRGWKFGWLTEELAISHCNGNIGKLEDLGYVLMWVLSNRYRILPDGQVMYLEWP